MHRNFNTMLISTALIAVGVRLAHAQQTLWTTNPDMPTFVGSNPIGPSVVTPLSNTEVADDFNVIGLVQKVLADGDDCQGCFGNQPVTGVYVRFYQWTPTGPGALQSEQFLGASDPGFVWTPAFGPEYLEITLPTPFQATGWHYVSVQVAFSAQSSSTGKWHFYPRNWGATAGGRVMFRNNTTGGTWNQWGASPHDASFALVGVSGGPPPMSILNAVSHPITPSCRLRINGDGFGDTQGSGTVAVNGTPAIVTQWTDDVIIAYVPESTNTGTAELTVVNDSVEQASLNIEVLPRTADGRVKWRFAVDADFMIHRPGVGPDGSIYCNDYNDGRLYKISPDGGLEWIIDALRGQVGLGGEGPVVVGDDGTAYVAVNPLGPTTELVAYHPDGTLKWLFIEPDSMSVAAGPAIGPDGHIYIAFHDVDQQSMGICAFTPEGEMLWNNNGTPPLYEHGGLGAELVFGPSTPGGPIDQVVLTVDRDDDPYLYAFDMNDGTQNWAVPRGVTQDPFLQFQIQPETGPDGTVYMTEFTGFGGLGWGLKAFDASDGSFLWRFDPDIASGASGPEAGSDGKVYFSWDISRVSAVSPSGQGLWTHVDFAGVRTQPTITANNAVVLVGGGEFGESGTFKALDAGTGSELWKIQLIDEGGNIVPDNRPLTTPDSTVSYWPTVILADPPAFQYCYLYAVEIDEGQPPIPGDVNGDGSVNVADLLAVISAWGPCPAPPAQCPADVAPAGGDGAVNVADLLLVISNWG